MNQNAHITQTTSKLSHMN